MEDNNGVKKAKGTKKCVIKRLLKFGDCKDSLLNNKTVLKSQQRFKSERHDVYTEEIDKIAEAVMMIKGCKLLIKSHDILMGKVLEKYVKQSY